MLIKTLHILGVVWLCLTAVLVFGGMVSVLIFRGLWEFWAIASPFNIWNWGLAALAASPGFFLIWLSEKLRQR